MSQQTLDFHPYIKDVAPVPPVLIPVTAQSLTETPQSLKETPETLKETPASLNQVRALAARLHRFLEDQEFRMRLAEEKRVERLKRRYRPEYRIAA